MGGLESFVKPAISAAVGYFTGGPMGAMLAGGSSFLMDAMKEEPEAPAPIAFEAPAPAPAPAAAPAAAPEPKVDTPTAMPTPLPDNQAIQAAKKKSIAAQIKRRGRASTILTDLSSSDSLGG